MMRVRTRSIPTVGGLDVSFSIAPQIFLQTWTKEITEQKMFHQPVECSFHLELSNQDVFIEGEVRTVLRPVCDRCAEYFELPFYMKVALTCSPQPKQVAGFDWSQESEEGLVYFKQEELDLEEIVREQFFLALPMSYVCHDDCLGLCTHCGANLNNGDHDCKKK